MVISFSLIGCQPDGPASDEGRSYTSSYVDETRRSIKALSDDRIEGLLSGEGLGYALAAELNGYPGPRHVLDLGDSLGLTVEQRREIAGTFDAMQDAASAAGERLVRAEAKLDSLFAAKQASKRDVRAWVEEAARHEADVRYAHLSTHLETAELMTSDQISAYNRLRGYAGDGAHLHSSGHH